jgi:hypothetical protein
LLTATLHDLAEVPVFRTRTDATYPCSQLAGTLTVTEKTGEAEVFSGTGERDVLVGRADERDGEGDGEADERRADGVADGDEEEEEAEGVSAYDGEIGTCGIDGSTTLGCSVASAGPTARTAIQTTSMTSTAAAALRTMRAGPSERAECFAGKRATLR